MRYLAAVLIVMGFCFAFQMVLSSGQGSEAGARESVRIATAGFLMMATGFMIAALWP